MSTRHPKGPSEHFSLATPNKFQFRLRSPWTLGTLFPGDTKQVPVPILDPLGTLFPGDNQTTQTHTWTQNLSKPNVHSENTIVPESGAWILRSISLRPRFRGGLHLNKLIVHFENTVVLESGQPHCLSHSPQRLATAIYFPTTSHQLRHFFCSLFFICPSRSNSQFAHFF